MTEPVYAVLVVGRPRRIRAHLLPLPPASPPALLLTVGRTDTWQGVPVRWVRCAPGMP
ncbi:hypothetical protein [Streptomyces sp. NPDC092903]|uniref:hypothetical protein n=1 Tax=Streptomyces sp. NPDC092903 TaxID=3366017 RepID=UPI0037FD3B9F